MKPRFAVLLAALSVSFACGSSQKAGTKKSKEKKTAKALVEEGIAAEEDKKYERAEKRYRKAIRLKPANEDANTRLVEMLSRQERHDDAVAAAKAYVDADESNALAYYLKAKVERSAGQLEPAEDSLSKLIERDPTDPDASFLRGEVRLLLKNFPGAVTDFQTAVATDGENEDFLLGLGTALHQNREHERALATLTKVLEKNEDNARANRIVGTVHRDAINHEEALRFHLKAVRLDPKSGRAHFELGITQNLRGDNVAAEESLRMATELEPEFAINWYAYGESLRVQDKNDQAIDAYKKTLEIEQDHPKAATKLGYVLYKSGQIDESEVVLTAAIKRNPKDPYPYFNLGFVYADSKKYTLAVNSFKRFIELAPEADRDIPVAKKQIRSLTRKIRR